MPDGLKGSGALKMPGPAGVDLGDAELEDAYDVLPQGYDCDPAEPADAAGIAPPFAEFMRDLDVCLKALEAEDAVEESAAAASQLNRYQPFEAAGGRVNNHAAVSIEALTEGRRLPTAPVEDGARSFQELWHDLEASLNRQPRPR